MVNRSQPLREKLIIEGYSVYYFEAYGGLDDFTPSTATSFGNSLIQRIDELRTFAAHVFVDDRSGDVPTENHGRISLDEFQSKLIDPIFYLWRPDFAEVSFDHSGMYAPYSINVEIVDGNCRNAYVSI